MDKIIIKDLFIRGTIGFQPWEKEKKQDILINLTLFADMSEAAKSDDVTDALNYKTITKRIIAHVESEETKNDLLESLSDQIARICIEGGVERAIVRVEKPGALRFTRSVGVEIDRSKADYA